jgi:uncharacterized membrane protein
MGMTSAFYREQARESLRGNWGKAIIVCLLGTLLGADVVTLGTVENRRDSIQDNIEYFRHTVDSSVFRMFLLIFLGVVSIILVYSIIAFIIGGAIQLGMITFFIGLHQGEQVRVSDLFSQFQSFGKALGLRIVTVFFVWLWSLLLVIPGLIAVFRYSMAPYILAENPDIGIMEALDLSKQMMMGNKLRLLFLGLSFFGWMMLGVITGGIALLWVSPYIEAAYAAFYLDISSAEQGTAYM